MKLPKIFLKKLLLGAVCIAVAALASLALKDIVDSYNPESSLPILEINNVYTSPLVSGDGSPEKSLVRANYSWRFITGVKEGLSLGPSDFAMLPVSVLPSTPILFHFSREPESLSISRATGAYPSEEDFIRYNGSALAGEINTPSTPGTYVYRIEAQFDRGSILYYLFLRVDDLAATG
ncbi:MAG: hypothetical protein Q4G07_06650 [Oscillospiraceae bacterium]|nr:hypothetical protein [Oscillospiraceae bacterium]